jgi:hypothetical protein
MNAALLLTAALITQPIEPPLRFQAGKDATTIHAKLAAAHAAKLPAGRLTQEDGESILGVSLLSDDKKTPGPAMLGKYERNDNELHFTPRFGLEPGQTYRASLKLGDKTLTLDYRVPDLKNQTPPKVIRVYPTGNVLPANHLKFYIYFDRPMRGGKELFKLIELVDEKGNVIADPWLIDEIWDEENNCLIIYIHPGRIKWGVDLRELLGPVLFEKRSYSFRIRSELSDRAGNKLGNDYVKKFRTTSEDRVRIELADWKLTAPKAGTMEPLTLEFNKSIDHRSLQRFLTVRDDKGKPVDGRVEIGFDEKSWSLTPHVPWQARAYRLDVDPQLEDVAGNTPQRPFDHDLNSPKLPPQKLRFEFEAR